MIIIDNFVEDPYQERAYALDLPYGDVIAQGITYKRIAIPEPKRYDLWELILRRSKKLVVPKADFYRMNIGSEPDSTWNIHSDLNFADMIGIHYLNLPGQCKGGTSIWKHKSTGMTKPDSPVPQFQVELFGADRNDQSKWELVQHIEMKFNRFVAFDSRLFHSREPRDLSFFGDDPETARLVHVFFYDLR